MNPSFARRRPTVRRSLLRLVLPLVAALGSMQPFAQERVHVVRQGDTLWDIAGEYLHSPLHWPDVQQRNGVGDPKRLHPGTALHLDPAFFRRAADTRGTPDTAVNDDDASRPAGRGRSAAPARATWTQDPLAVAGVAELSGAARMKRGDAAPRPLDAGTPVRAGDILETDERTYLSFRLRDGSTLVMPSSSTVRVVVANGQATQLQLLDGRIEALVAKQHGRTFEIRTRMATLGVRGTHFRVRDEHGAVTAEVLSGVVAVSTQGKPELVLDARQGAALAGAGALESRALLAPPTLAESADGKRVLIASAVQGAQGYRLLLATDPSFIHGAYEATAPDGRFTLPDDLPGGFYHARASAFDARNIEGMPGESIVHVQDDRQTDTVVQTRDGRYEIRWPAPDGQRCLFELARSPDFASPVVTDPAVYGAGAVVGPLTVPGRYYWRARLVTVGDDRTLASGSFDVPQPAAARD
ncbi:hypothetical protein GQ57_17655 [Burkholderia sp. MSh2]|uniref:LysM domain-containing protein n=1 Tax=Burkholderia paludis TaxID=1506587 RepID=A0A6J5EI81_9BURK|nr:MULTISPECIES: FecR domain-containing protein [Burkholderia]KEZ04460.1 hypothetical protein GQ57_17655 [Burkholderia sp. MSh2]KFG93408.1 hypothetical protein GQ56_0132100 [Burkholderia paludis]CAB3764745.1 hypothetical protein LMG30113_04796 [Burkholderia paludis]VWC09141.1 LysM domain-containing protein [Burkholderia paludis]